ITVRFSKAAEDHGGKILLVSALAAVVSIYGLSQLEVENRFIDYFHEDSEIYQGMSVIDKQLGGTVTLEILLDADTALAQNVAADEEDPFAEPDFDAEESAVAITSDDDFADDAFDDPFAEEDAFADGTATATNGPSYWFSVSGLDDIKKLHDYLESLPEVGKVQSLAIAYQVSQDI